MEPFHVERAISSSMCIDVNLILIGKDTWAAILGSGSVLLAETHNPRPDCATALLRAGMDPRSMVRIRAGAKVLAYEMIGVVAGAPVVCGDVDVVERS